MIIALIGLLVLIGMATGTYYLLKNSDWSNVGTVKVKEHVYAKQLKNGLGEVKWTPFDPMNHLRRYYTYERNPGVGEWSKHRSYGMTLALFDSQEDAEAIGLSGYQASKLADDARKSQEWDEI